MPSERMRRERLARGFTPKPWACSVKEVDWAGFSFEGSKLGYLVGQCGWFHHGHRAVDDCHALLEILAVSLPGDNGSALSHLLIRAETTASGSGRRTHLTISRIS